MSTTVRVRFAPSPTGYLHVGGLRTALYNYLFARHNNGRFILRIEDTDRTRMVEGAVDNLISTLRWTGLEFDEGPGKEGACGPYVQSQRLPLYREHAQRLVQQGHAYYCFCTQRRLDDLRRQQEEKKLPIAYDRHCRVLRNDEVEHRLRANEPSVIRMKAPLDGETTFVDRIRGKITIANSMVDDQVLLKSDGFPTYHLAVVVDDHLMGISHVIRGEEWISSTPKYLLLCHFFGWQLPQFAHLPLLLNPDKSKLSKRQGGATVEEYREKGYLPEAIVNFVALLGWNPGDDRELFTLDELTREFSLERVGRSGAIFNVEKLNWLNFQHLRRKPAEEVLQLLKEQMNRAGIDAGRFRDDYLLRVIESMRERAVFVKDFVEKCPYFFNPPESYEEEIVRKRWKKETPDYLRTLIAELDGMHEPTKADYEAALDKVAAALNIRKGELIHPLRLAVSGTGVGPGLYDILFILGKQETIRRVQTAIERLQKYTKEDSGAAA
jgi:glutamyl-tRNA synthetase